MGENDLGASTGTISTNATDLIGFRNLKAFGNPVYINTISPAAGNHLGSVLSVRFNGTNQFFNNTLLASATDNFCIEAWVKPDTITGATRVIAYNGNTTNNGWGIVQDGTRYFGLFGGVAAIGPGAATANSWTHVALVRASGSAILYINGIPAGSASMIAPVPAVSGNGFAVAACPQSPAAQFFAGTVDEARVSTFGNGQFSNSNLLVNLGRITTLGASGLAPDSATLNGRANAAGLPSSLWFQWGTNHENITPAQSLGSGSSLTNFTQVLSGLSSGATYKVQAVVSNALGIVIGAETNFTVPLLPPVSNTNDDGPGSLRQIIAEAPAGATITFTPGMSGTITLTTGPLVINKSLNIVGPGSRLMFLTTGSAGTAMTFSSGTVNMSGLTISQGGDVSGAPAIDNAANLTLKNCTLTANTGIGLRHVTNKLVLQSCAFTENASGCLLIGLGANASITNCTFGRNNGGPNPGAILNGGTLNLLSSTIAYNFGSLAGGVFSTGAVYAGNCVIAQNQRFTNLTWIPQDATGAFESLGFNFIAARDGSSGFTNGINQDQVGTSSSPLYAMLYSLPLFNGGTSVSMTPIIGSPLIDRGHSLGVASDQRGYARPLDFPQIVNAFGGDGTDIGAVELGSGSVCTDHCSEIVIRLDRVLRIAEPRWFGVNVASWLPNFDSTNRLNLLNELGCRALRFPGGSLADVYHWSSNLFNGQAGALATTFENFMDVATNVGATVVITANYGTGTTNEAADWVRCSNITNHCNFKYWEIGNENYTFLEADSNTNAPYQPHDPWSYAVRFRDYYHAMKTADPTIKVGAVAVPGEDTLNYYQDHPAINPRTGLSHRGWTPVMLSTLRSLNVTPDFIVHHYYPESGIESDPLLLQASCNWANDAEDLRQQITDYLGSLGTNTELVCTENNSDASFSQGRQSTSLVNGLYLADSMARLMKTEFNSWFWWLFESGADKKGDFGPALYGWRTNGDFGLTLNITNRYPTFYAMKLMQHFAHEGDLILDVDSGNLFLPAYAAKRPDGSLNVLVINKERTNALARKMVINGFSSDSIAMLRSYGIPQDEAAHTDAPLAFQDIATNRFVVSEATFMHSFAPYSLSLFTLIPSGPLLKIRNDETGNPMISWPWPSAGWQLQQTGEPTSTNWTPVSGSVQSDGINNFLSITLSSTNTFYRLSKF